MAEIVDGYFCVFDQFLYYADKDNLGNWVVVCNKPDCYHKDQSCNGNLSTSSSIWLKNNQFYQIERDNEEDYFYIYEKPIDGSDAKKVYEIKPEYNSNGGGYATFQDKFVIRYTYLDERGLLQERILYVEDYGTNQVSTHTLYADAVNNASLVMSGNEYWGIRGENLIVTTRQLEEGGVASNNLCKIEDGKIEPLNLPDEIPLLYGYFKDNVFTYYKQQEGFYQYNIQTGEQEFLFENQLEDGQGFILSEDCIIECNRYGNFVPKEAYLKLYNGEEWITIELPEEIAKSSNSFYPVSIASDRIFFRMNITKEGSNVATGMYLYYMMLEEENPQLVFAGKIGDGELEEETSTAESENDVFAKFEEVTIFDTEEYFVKATDVYLDDKNRCCVDFYFENRSLDTEYDMSVGQCAINGIQCATSWAIGSIPKVGESKTYTLCFNDDRVDTSKVSEFYKSSEYTDIEMDCCIGFGTDTVRNIVHLYPQGEENAISFTREPQENDIVLVNNDYVSVIITGYEENFVPNDIINVVIENKHEQSLVIKVEESSANGIAVIPNVYYGTYWTIVNPGAVVLYPMTLFDDENMGSPEGPNRMEPNRTFFDRTNITSIEEIEMLLRIMEYNPITGYDEENNIVYETFVLNP